MDRDSWQHYQDLINYIPDPIVIIGNGCRITMVNDALLIMQEDSRENLIGNSCHKVLHHQDFPCHLSDSACPFKEVFKSGKPLKLTHRHFSKQGKEVLVDLAASPIRNNDGEIIGMLELMRDITFSARLEEESKQSLAFLSSVLEGIGEGVIVVDRDYCILSANKGYLTQVGSASEHVVGKHCYAVSHHFEAPCSGNGHDCPVRVVFETGSPAKVMHVHYDQTGRKIYVECHAYPIQDESGMVIRAIETLNDVTERVRLEEKLKESEQKYRDLYDNAPDGYYSLAGNGLIIEVNKTFLNMLGYCRDEVVGKMFIEELLSGKSVQTCHNKFPELKKAGRMEHVELTLVRKDGSLLPIMMNASAVYDGEGNFLMSRSVMRDISERKKADDEKRKLREQLFQSQKLEALGTLAGGIAHDFNNMLASILGYSSLAKADLSDSDPLYRHIGIIEAASLRASELTEQLLAFAKGGKYNAKPSNVNIIIRDVAALLEPIIDKNISLNVYTDGSSWPAICDAGQIQQVILNLSINGRDAMPQGGTLTIRTENIRLGIGDVQYLVDVVPGDYVRISVSDTGSGMDRHTQQHMFEPFFTTKEKGTGLGLALVYGIIKKHNGFIQVFSEPGRGSTFEVNLIACTGEHVCTEKRKRTEVHHGTGTILVVDDEPLVRQLASDILKRFGYSVLMANCGEEAVALYRKQVGEIKAVLLDIVMPDMDGRAVFRQLRSVNPHVAVIFSSGNNRESDADDLLAQGAAGFVQKPYRIADLLSVVNEVAVRKNWGK
jgi:two-component system cell cycle sensor histidine kinase/response regulator CckA